MNKRNFWTFFVLSTVSNLAMILTLFYNFGIKDSVSVFSSIFSDESPSVMLLVFFICSVVLSLTFSVITWKKSEGTLIRSLVILTALPTTVLILIITMLAGVGYLLFKFLTKTLGISAPPLTDDPLPGKSNPLGASNKAYYDSSGSIDRIGDKRVYYDSSGNVDKIGNDKVYYDNLGNIDKIGDKKVYYDSSGKIDRIGSDKVYYDSSGNIDKID